ncbi:YhdP family protein [Pseudoalteromonas phenolica]|uniref:YhdP central domain-containing protein n=1 Tax=Pseudoalteromonas phenolica TaxID=161398 RepID=A0A0S2JY22_9GAMM|nr:YhdP family protein [Pseudoalteromonas phenolica]ALO40756.1 hypothetical protein PP2015_229 [Pseudoalteromonas phenolica]MBE0354725.1 hypothetical protein [Pseudoalteromonas phenolica O-BC30]
MQVKAVCFFCLRKVWQLIAVTLVLLAVLVSVFRYSLPYANDYKHDLEVLINEQFDVDLRIGSITASWEGVGPALVLENVTFDDNNNSPIRLRIDNTSLQINVIESLRFLQLRSDYFVLEGFAADVDLNALDISTQQSDTEFEQQALIESLFLGESGHFAIKNSSLNLTMRNGKEHTLLLEDVIWQNNVLAHRGTGVVGIPGLTEGQLSADLLLTGKTLAELAGEVYFQASQVDLQDWLSPYLDENKQDLHTDINGQMWLSLAHGKVKNIQLNMKPSHIHWQQNDQAQQLSLMQAKGLMLPSESGWSLQSSEINFTRNNLAYTDISIVAELAERQSVWFKGLDLPLISEFIQLTNLPNTDLIAELAPEGALQGKLEFQAKAAPKVWLYSDKLKWQYARGIPATEPMRLEMNAIGEQAVIELSAQQGQLHTADMFAKPIAYEQLVGRFDIYKFNDHWRVTSDSIWLDNEDLTLAAEMQLRLLEHPELDLYVEVKGGNGKIAKNYFPQTLMAESLINYLNDAIKAGQHLGSQVLLSGKLADFPYIDKTGRFEVLSELTQAEFAFAPEWPAVKEAAATLHFVNERMDIYVDEGKLINQSIDGGVQVSLANLEQANNLIVDIKQTTPAQSLGAFFAETPLKDPLTNVFDVVQAQGSVTGDVLLDIDLKSLAVNATGRVLLDDNSVYLAQPGMQLNQVNGTLDFNDEIIDLKAATASWLDMPITLSVHGASHAQSYKVEIDTLLKASTDKLLPYGHGIMYGYLDGATDLKTHVTLDFAPQGFTYNADFKSDLVGLESLLPLPYSKEAETSWPLSGQVRGDDISNLITASIQEKLFFNAILENETGRFSNTHIIAARQDRGLAQQDFQVSIELPEVALVPWIDFIDRLIQLSAKPSDKPSMLPKLHEISAQINALTISGLPFNDFEMRLKPVAAGTQIRLNAKELRATVAVPEGGSSRPIQIESDFLRLNVPESESDAATSEPDSAESLQWLTRMPAIEMLCADCRVKTYQLDKVSLSMFGDGEKFNISELVVDKQDHVFRGQGSWQDGMTEISGIMNSRDIGELLSEFDLTSSIKDSKANMHYQLSWQGAPYKVHVPSLAGDIQWELGEGHLSEVSDKGARVFSLLSLDSLVRKLKLDFRDVFSKGFFYNSMEGSMQIAEGIAYTKDTKMDGVPADLTIQGFANLDTQEINYDLAVAPQVTSSLPVIVGWMVNPVTGIAALALDQVLHSARVISEIKFKVTGTMQEPVVTEIDRKSREIELPKPAQSEPPAPSEQPASQPVAEGGTVIQPPSDAGLTQSEKLETNQASLETQQNEQSKNTDKANEGGN